MGKKRKSVMKPWCWYCDREFADDKVLINHQKAKHFKCSYCHKKLNTIGGLVVHLQDVHKEHTNIVPNCIPGRETIDIEIFGMEGIPYEDLQRHIAKKQPQQKTFDQSNLKEEFSRYTGPIDEPDSSVQMEREYSIEEKRAQLPKYQLII